MCVYIYIYYTSYTCKHIRNIIHTYIYIYIHNICVCGAKFHFLISSPHTDRGLLKHHSIALPAAGEMLRKFCWIQESQHPAL